MKSCLSREANAWIPGERHFGNKIRIEAERLGQLGFLFEAAMSSQLWRSAAACR